MGKRLHDSDAVDPDLERWRRQYPRFPGAAECARLIREGKAQGSWAEIIVQELAAHSVPHLSELISTFRTESDANVRLYVMMALDIARPPQAVSFLSEVVREGDPRFGGFAESALRGIDTREARKALWDATHP